MKVKRYIKFILFLCCFVAIEVFGQIFDIENNSMRINQLDSLGQKEGFWVEDDFLIYYTNGKFNGSVIRFTKERNDLTARIVYEMQYQNGNPSGPLIIYDENGNVGLIYTKFLPNTDFVGVQKFYTQDSVFPYQAYTYDFYPNGTLKAKGWTILNDDYITEGERVGVWQYYDLEGNEETVDFSKDDVKHSRCE